MHSPMFAPRFGLPGSRRIRLALCALLAMTLLALSWPAQADLMLHPTRIVFDKNQRAAQVELMATTGRSRPATAFRWSTAA